MPMPMSHLFVSRDDWPEFCRISTDIAVGSDYDAFVKRVEHFKKRVVADGHVFVQIDVKPADLLAWCRARNREVNASSRADYAAFRLIDLKQ